MQYPWNSMYQKYQQTEGKKEIVWGYDDLRKSNMLHEQLICYWKNF